MYLAEHFINGRKRYAIRDSQYDPGADCWVSRELFDLGGAPADFIRYPGGNSFYIDERIGERLATQGCAYDLCELEELFWCFIRKDIRQKLEPFHCRGRRRGPGRKKREAAGRQDVHFFDKRRLYYLRCGAVDQRNIERVPQRFFSGLRNKSRDEIEQYFIGLEKSLNSREYKLYAYSAFDLQRHFVASSARYVPQALDREEMDGNFLRELCRLHRDKSFWAGFPLPEKLHAYLVRYAVMFFDFEFDGASAWQEYLQNLISSKRYYRPPPPKAKAAMSDIAEIFGVPGEILQKMDKGELAKLYRKKAHELHPDKGGTHEAFVKLAEAYKELLLRKS